MARRRTYARRSTAKRPAGRRVAARSYNTGRKSYARKGASRTTRRTASLGRTLRIVIEQPQASGVARPDLIGVKPELVRKNVHRSRF